MTRAILNVTDLIVVPLMAALVVASSARSMWAAPRVEFAVAFLTAVALIMRAAVMWAREDIASGGAR